MPPYKPLKERFWSKVCEGAQPDDCWLWTGGLHKAGYGSIGANGKSFLAHRLSWTWERGAIPDGMSVLHKCDVRTCVNPRHLWLGTRVENNKDRDTKGRTRGKSFRGRTNPGAVLYEAQVLAIYRENGTYDAIGKRYGVGRGAIYDIKKGRNWAWLTGAKQRLRKVA